jgi:hypothetical protein
MELDLTLLRYSADASVADGFRIGCPGIEPPAEGVWCIDVGPVTLLAALAKVRVFVVRIVFPEDQAMSCLATFALHLRSIELGTEGHYYSTISTTSLTTALMLAQEAARLIVKHPPHGRDRMPVLLRQPSDQERAKLADLIAAYEARDMGVVPNLLDLLIGGGLIDDWELEMASPNTMGTTWRDLVRKPIEKLVRLGLIPKRPEDQQWKRWQARFGAKRVPVI